MSDVFESEGQLFKKVALSQEDIEKVIKELEESIKETTDKIVYLNKFLPKEEELEEDSTEKEQQIGSLY